MLRREGWTVNRKRVYRWYRLDGLQLRMRLRRRKHMCVHRGAVPLAMRRRERWSMDFVHDQLIDGRPIRMLTVVDQWSRESVLIEPAFSFSGRKVAEVLEWPVIHSGAHGRSRLITDRSSPRSRSRNGHTGTVSSLILSDRESPQKTAISSHSTVDYAMSV